MNAPVSRSTSRNAPTGPSPFRVDADALPQKKFSDPELTAKGERRAHVPFTGLETLWFNTGTLCNLACATCYIESSPTNDALVYIRHADVSRFLDEIAADKLPTTEIGYTGGEPFMNPEFLAMLEETLKRGFSALVLSNAMKPMMRHRDALLALNARYGGRLTIRVSVDHHTRAGHEGERGPNSWTPMTGGLRWLSDNRFSIAVAGRQMPGEKLPDARSGYARMFEDHGVRIDAQDASRLVLFPEMDEGKDIAEITEDCWGILGQNPADIMCATSRMVVHRKGEAAPRVAACTLIPYDNQFDMGETLADASGDISLNHPHCARFCVLGGASCAA